MDHPCSSLEKRRTRHGTNSRATIFDEVAEYGRSPDDSLTPAEVAKQFGITVGTLKNWRTLGTGPAYSKPSHRVIYRRADVDAYQAARRIEPKGRGQ